MLRRFNVRFVITMLIFTALLIAVSVGLFLNLRSTSYQAVQDSLRFYDNRLSIEMDQNILSLMESCSSDPDVVRLRTANDRDEETGCIVRIKNKLSSRITIHSVIRGFFLFYPENDTFLPVYSTANTGTISGYPFPSFIRDILRSHPADSSGRSDLPGNWFLVEDQNCLLRIFRFGGIYGGAWIDLVNLPGFSDSSTGAVSDYEHDFFDEDTIQMITDTSGKILYVDDPPQIKSGIPDFRDNLVLPVERSLTRPVTVPIPGLGRRIVISYKQSFSDYCFTVLLPQGQFYRAFRPFYILLTLLIIWAILFFIAFNRMAREIIAIPVRSLVSVTENIHSGNMDSRILPPNDYEETVRIIDAFNKLLSEIGELRISIYEEQLQAREFELKALKNQIAPHFLINCLNSVFMSAQDQSRLEVTNKLISTLSSHLRYTLADRDIVPLSEELEYLDNYILLTQYRFPDTLSYEKEIDSDILDAQVFSMILLTLTENSIKTGLIMGEPFLIRVRASKKTENGQTFVCLEHTDSGTGLSEEKMEKYNHILDHPEVTEKGTGIGLYNTAMRLRLIMGTEASLVFANEEGMGLRVTIRFPYRQYREPGEEA